MPTFPSRQLDHPVTADDPEAVQIPPEADGRNDSDESVYDKPTPLEVLNNGEQPEPEVVEHDDEPDADPDDE